MERIVHRRKRVFGFAAMSPLMRCIVYLGATFALFLTFGANVLAQEPTPTPTPPTPDPGRRGRINSRSRVTNFIIGVRADTKLTASTSDDNEAAGGTGSTGQNASAGVLYGISQSNGVRTDTLLFHIVDSETLSGTAKLSEAGNGFSALQARLLNPYFQGLSFNLGQERFFSPRDAPGNAKRDRLGWYGNVGFSSTKFETNFTSTSAASSAGQVALNGKQTGDVPGSGSGTDTAASVTTETTRLSAAILFLNAGLQYQSPEQQVNKDTFSYLLRGGLTTRFLAGNITQNKAFLQNALGTTKTFFPGIEGYFQLNLGSISPYARVTWFPFGKAIHGFSGAQTIIGINATLFFQSGATPEDNVETDALANLDALLVTLKDKPLNDEAQGNLNVVLEQLYEGAGKPSAAPQPDTKVDWPPSIQILLGTLSKANQDYSLDKEDTKVLRQFIDALPVYQYDVEPIRELIRRLGSRRLNEKTGNIETVGNPPKIQGKSGSLLNNNPLTEKDVNELREIIRDADRGTVNANIKAQAQTWLRRGRITISDAKKFASIQRSEVRNAVPGATNTEDSLLMNFPGKFRPSTVNP